MVIGVVASVPLYLGAMFMVAGSLPKDLADFIGLAIMAGGMGCVLGFAVHKEFGTREK
jgi:hypothetical protein